MQSRRGRQLSRVPERPNDDEPRARIITLAWNVLFAAVNISYFNSLTACGNDLSVFQKRIHFIATLVS